MSAKARKSKTPDKPLMDTGTMSRGKTGASRKFGFVKLDRARGDAVTGGYESISEIHQKGLGRVPAREHWGVYKKAEEIIEKGWKEQLKAIVKTLRGF